MSTSQPTQAPSQASADDRLGVLATRHPEAIQVLLELGLDFCCGGADTLAEACVKRAVDPQLVLARIREARPDPSTALVRWDEQPLGAVIDHILAEYHAELRGELGTVGELAHRVQAAHASNHGPLVAGIAQHVDALADELSAHMDKEERVLFPWIRQGNGRTAGNPIRVMQIEHEEAAGRLAQLALLTHGYRVPDDGCVTWEALYGRLERLDRRLREHIHLENNILFPRALTA